MVDDELADHDESDDEVPDGAEDVAGAGVDVTACEASSCGAFAGQTQT